MAVVNKTVSFPIYDLLQLKTFILESKRPQLGKPMTRQASKSKLSSPHVLDH